MRVLFLELRPEILPEVAVLFVVVLTVQFAHDTEHGEPLLGVLLVTDEADLTLIEKGIEILSIMRSVL